ncbi:carbohydrate ABC transporter substrate-binding protein, CUT1 family [Paenibacillus sp. cl141a]|uniref:extracellular solute-binding protein n=1 Tax=Paenibacillus sp. cl141a TaxID=1761877 RepID=UPI0008BDA6E3|nr:extracellular solute-binding protein [Paenibacillus sp. cl141a]SEL94818.1 carbohydrate ABC transporter substrate-binding protein, CUT1 family [Paenibacillus sp. cl141a]
MKRKTMKRFVVVLLVISMLAIAGCGSKSTNTEPGNHNVGEPVKIEIMANNYGTNPPQNDFVKKALDEALDTDITLTLGSADYATQLGTRIASGDFPDMFMLGSEELRKYSKMGVLLDMTPYMDQLSGYKEMVDADTIKLGLIDGKQYSLPKPIARKPAGILWIRKDWLDTLGLKVPTTTDELLKVLKAFTENDPDGNKKKDTYGFTGNDLTAFNALFGAYGLTNGGAQFISRDGKAINVLDQPEMKDALELIKQYISSGVVDPDVMSNTVSQLFEKASQGKAGVIYTDWTNIMKDDKVAIWKNANPQADWIALNPVAGPTGVAYDGHSDIGAPSEMFAISKNVEKDPEKLNKIIEMLNYVSTGEGAQLVQFGIKDTHFTETDGKITITDLGQQETNYTFLYQFTGRPNLEYLKVKFPNQVQYIEETFRREFIEALDGFIVPPDGFNKADSDRYITEEFIKFIYNKRPISEYNDFLKTLDSTFNYKLYKESAFEQLAKLGYRQ